MVKDINDPTQLVFRALAHPARRDVLVALLDRAGQSIAELMAGCDMTRQTFTQHLDALIDADLVRFSYEGRERLHYLNVLPLVHVTDEWMARFVNPQVRALLGLRQNVEAESKAAKRRA